MNLFISILTQRPPSFETASASILSLNIFNISQCIQGSGSCSRVIIVIRGAMRMCDAITLGGTRHAATKMKRILFGRTYAVRTVHSTYYLHDCRTTGRSNWKLKGLNNTCFYFLQSYSYNYMSNRWCQRSDIEFYLTSFASFIFRCYLHLLNNNVQKSSKNEWKLVRKNLKHDGA